MKQWLATERRLLFAETDMSGWAHNSHFMRFVENAEHELFQKLGEQPVTPEGGWPRVNFQIDFRSPLVFDDPYQVALTMKRLGNTSITWGFIIHADTRLVAEGQMTSVYVNSTGKPTPIPESLKSGLISTFDRE